MEPAFSKYVFRFVLFVVIIYILLFWSFKGPPFISTSSTYSLWQPASKYQESQTWTTTILRRQNSSRLESSLSQRTRHADTSQQVMAGSTRPSPAGSVDTATLYVSLDNFRQHLKKKYIECRDVEDPFKLWKSPFSYKTNFTAKTDFERIELASLCGGLLYPEFFTTPPRAALYPMEVRYFSEPPVFNESLISSHVNSTINLVGSSSNFTVGDTVAFIIKIRDGEGRPKNRGGDRVRVVLKDVEGAHSIHVKVIDFDNGTYLATTKLPWAGKIRVVALLKRPREFFRALLFTHRTLRSTTIYVGAYNNSQASEGVPCGPFPVVPGFGPTEICNLTSLNGFPWFCGRPGKRELTCSDFSLYRHSKATVDPLVTATEDRLLREKIADKHIQGEILLTVRSAKPDMTRLKDPETPCHLVPSASTWHQPSPSGYFYNRVWRSFLCRIPETLDPSCFRNAHMIFYGDSNSREFYMSVMRRAKCKEARYLKKVHWHSPRICSKTWDNFTMQFVAHSNPFHSGAKSYANVTWLHSPTRLFQRIPDSGRYMVSFNPFLHFTAHHISAYERALVVIREAIVALLQRNPQVLLILRGPHTAEVVPRFHLMGDNLAEHYQTLQQEVFKDLQDRVIYFPTWDITGASGDTIIHPKCNDHIAHVMLQFMCGRGK